MKFPAWIPQAITLIVFAFGAVVAWATLTEQVRELRSASDAHGVRISAIEGDRSEIAGLKIETRWAADHAEGARILAATLLSDRLNHDCGKP